MITGLLSKIAQTISDHYNNNNREETDNTETSSNNNNQQQKVKEDLPPEWDDLFCLCYDNEYEVVQELLKDEPSRINITDNTKSTVLHIVTAKGHINTLKVLLTHFNFDINTQNAKGHNPLIIAACNGNLEIFNMILEYGKHNLQLSSNNMETSLFFAVSNGHMEIVKKLLEYSQKVHDEKEHKEYLDSFNIHGVSPIHVAVLKNNMDLLKMLLESGADVNAYKKDGSTSLHIAAISGNAEAARVLLKNGANIMTANRFGSTPIHEACIKCQPEVVEVLLQHEKALVNLKDKDGSSPLHLACNLSQSNVQGNISVVKVLLSHGANINEQDNGCATPLHILACIGDKAIEVTKLLLHNGANPTLENVYGWTPIHHVSVDQMSHTQTNQVLIEWFVKNKPEFLESLDRKKPRAKVVNSEPATDTSTPEQLGQELFDKVISDIECGKIKKIVVLTGAGISTAAGIPTYRSADNSQNFQADINDGNKMFSFSMESIQKDPTLYCESLRKHFYPSECGQSKSTATHHFINNLQKRGVLLRVFTQNVDSLQEQTGLNDDYIVHAHGSLKSWRCSHCSEEYDKDSVWNTIVHGRVPYCKVLRCQQIIRPNVIFFGEGLPVEFHRRAIKDFRECDCVIVIGTSLTVYPFAGLLNDPPSHVPRILINKEVVGPFRSINDIQEDTQQQQEQQQQQNQQPKQLRITARPGGKYLVVLSDCDVGTTLFSNRLKLTQ
ncbi:ankyrin repeat-containing protein [Tieghemostelium lacteum]|uniref:Ankyrin repeat-containing protein n=1 Tax=Tieghemostelium lacteum TaxID=361077 RepID=A0A151ZE70_TIELA|nr:ankyrin repeat-containing protein [Tieghemostelium lacteum]|eukprot:KYQ92184.1 ankyrin repeat-containing protein [Tieghemostelium lacteum]